MTMIGKSPYSRDESREPVAQLDPVEVADQFAAEIDSQPFTPPTDDEVEVVSAKISALLAGLFPASERHPEFVLVVLGQVGSHTHDDGTEHPETASMTMSNIEHDSSACAQLIHGAATIAQDHDERLSRLLDMVAERVLNEAGQNDEDRAEVDTERAEIQKAVADELDAAGVSYDFAPVPSGSKQLGIILADTANTDTAHAAISRAFDKLRDAGEVSGGHANTGLYL